MTLSLTTSMASSGQLQTIKRVAKTVFLFACRFVTVTFACNVNLTNKPTAQRALLPKALQCQQALPSPAHRHTYAHTSSDAFLVTQPQGPVLCSKVLIPCRKQAPLKPQTTPAQSSLTITSLLSRLKNQEGRKFRVQIALSLKCYYK